MDLCGAGHVARMLHHFEHELPGCEAWGLGVWQREDENFLYQLLQAPKVSRLPRGFFRSQARDYRATAKIRLVNLDEKHGETTQVVRLYHVADTGTEQLSRIDWEPPSQGRALTSQELASRLPAGDFDAIVVYDLRKGVVTETLIRQLRKAYPKAAWYVRSKKEEPAWLSEIEHHLNLLLLGPEVLQQRNPWGSWLIGNRITYQAKELLDKLPSTSVVLLLDSREVLALVDKKICLTVRGAEEIDSLSQVGWSSAFFTSLIFSMLQQQSEVTNEAISKAMGDANAHMADVKALINPSEGTATPIFPVNPQILWQEENDSWSKALSGTGVIPSVRTGSDGPSLSLEVWRGCTALPGYVACVREKRELINRIGRHLRAFRGVSAHSRSVSIMLQADPGTGKTFLAKSLARVFDFELVLGDVTQMLRREALLDLFDSVATKQANQDRPVLVFVDEVNALLDNANVYGAFLAPMEEGAYVRHGSAFNLKPCVWIFAGTGLEGASGRKADKVEDFESRTTMNAQFDYQSLLKQRDNVSLLDEARLEQVYLGVSMIRQFYPDVSVVSLGLLDAFRNLDPAKAPARTIRKNVLLLRNVQYGKITEENCHDWEIKVAADTPLVQLIFEVG